MKDIHASLMVGALTLAGFSAQAGQFDGSGTWAPSACGARPDAPTLNLKDPDAFNRSVEAANAYNKLANAYLDCLVKEANADIQGITKQANAARQGVKEVNERLQAEAKAAAEKFK